MTREQDLLDRCSGLPTPFLAVDLDAARRNIAAMAGLVEPSRVLLRPHFKAHKCPEIMRLQLDAPRTVGATCQTVAEAAVLADMGCRDILLTNQLVDERRVEELMRLPEDTSVAVLADRPEQVYVLGRCVAAARRRITVYIEVDVGLHRGGLQPDDPDAATVTEMIETAPFLTLGGVQAYEGHAVLEPDPVRRAQISIESQRRAKRFRERLSAMVGRRLVLTGGGTGTAAQVVAGGQYDELQCGSYVLMDAAYRRLGLPFEAALYCVSTALAVHPDGRVVLDAGMKSLSGDGLPRCPEPGLEILGLSDEHTRARRTTGQVQTGNRILLQPWHVDPTMNLHRDVVVVDGDDIRRSPVRGHHALAEVRAW